MNSGHSSEPEGQIVPRADRVPGRAATASLPVPEWPGDDHVLLRFGDGDDAQRPENSWYLKDAFQGAQIFGGTGSGKTSGSGYHIARQFLASKMGGLVLTAKTDELRNWMELAHDAGRFDDLWVFSPRNDFRFNFLQYELERKGEGAGQTENLVNLFCSVLEVAERRKGGSVGGGDSYWHYALKQLLRNTIDLALLAGAEVTLPNIYRIIASAPRSLAELREAAWQDRSLCFEYLTKAGTRSKEGDDFAIVDGYWTHEFPGLAEETRSVIVSTFTSMADCFLRGTLRELFCTGLNITPEKTFEGKIIVLNLLVKEWNELGQFAQVLFKFLWQRAVERRVPPELSRADAERTIRPVFLWADESQFFVNSYDAQFQSTARSSRSCTVYLTQNLPSYIAAFGGANGRSEAECFLGNMQLKVWHANGDPVTNSWAADTIGRARQIQLYGGLSHGATPQGMSQNAGGSMTYEFLVQPQEFTILRSGGPDYQMIVDGIAFQAGRSWLVAGKRQNFIATPFVQRA